MKCFQWSAGARAPFWAAAVAHVSRGIAPRALALMGIVGTMVLFTAILIGERYASHQVAGRELRIGNGVAASVDDILDQLKFRHRSELTRLVGRPCPEVRDALAALQTYVRYTRVVALVANGRVYCSSALGPIDVPLSAYVPLHSVSTRISLLRDTPFQSGTPVIAMFNPTGDGRGLLYIVEGAYISDDLSQAVRYGAQRAALSVRGGGLLRDDGTFLPALGLQSNYASTVESRQWPFAIHLSASTEFVSQMRWKYMLSFGVFGGLFDALLVACYLLAFAPRRLLLGAVRHALRHGELYVVYQPIVDMRSRALVGVEALLRWQHPKWGLINPAAFMGDAETSALLPAVTDFVLLTATSEIGRHRWQCPLHVAVNVGARDMNRNGFVGAVLAAAQQLPPGATLTLELTERLLLEDSSKVLRVFQILRSHGIRFAIDDFGTQHSNLDVLGRFPFDFVKIDRQFVSEVDTKGGELLRGLVSVARHFGLKMIAEGVETEQQHRALQTMEVPYAQGYLYQRPVRAEELVQSQGKSG